MVDMSHIIDPAIKSMNIPPFTSIVHLLKVHNSPLSWSAICVVSRRDERGGRLYTSKYNIFFYQHLLAAVCGKYRHLNSRPVSELLHKSKRQLSVKGLL